MWSVKFVHSSCICVIGAQNPTKESTKTWSKESRFCKPLNGGMLCCARRNYRRRPATLTVSLSSKFRPLAKVVFGVCWSPARANESKSEKGRQTNYSFNSANETTKTRTWIYTESKSHEHTYRSIFLVDVTKQWAKPAWLSGWVAHRSYALLMFTGRVFRLHCCFVEFFRFHILLFSEASQWLTTACCYTPINGSRDHCGESMWAVARVRFSHYGVWKHGVSIQSPGQFFAVLSAKE